MFNPHCQDLGPIFSLNSPRAWLRYMYGLKHILIARLLVKPQGSHKFGALQVFLRQNSPVTNIKYLANKVTVRVK